MGWGNRLYEEYKIKTIIIGGLIFMTATYNYLGYGVTDSNGKAKLEYDSEGDPLTHSYTGTGAGKVDIVASLDSEIDESSLVSETYEVLDTLFYDTGVTDGNTKWAYSNNFTINRTSDGTEISSTTNNDIYLANKDMDSDLYDYDTSFAVEFDLIEIIGNGMVHIKSANSKKNI